jgi:hypothetical protein
MLPDVGNERCGNRDGSIPTPADEAAALTPVRTARATALRRATLAHQSAWVGRTRVSATERLHGHHRCTMPHRR